MSYPSYLCFRSWIKWNRTSQWLLWAMCMYTTSVFHGKSCIPGTWIHTWLGFESMMEWNWISTQTFWFLLETQAHRKRQELHYFSVNSPTWTFGATVICITKGTFSTLGMEQSVTRTVEHSMIYSCPAVWKQPFVLLSNSRDIRSFQHSPFLPSVHRFSPQDKWLEDFF